MIKNFWKTTWRIMRFGLSFYILWKWHDCCVLFLFCDSVRWKRKHRWCKGSVKRLPYKANELVLLWWYWFTCIWQCLWSQILPNTMPAMSTMSVNHCFHRDRWQCTATKESLGVTMVFYLSRVYRHFLHHHGNVWYHPAFLYWQHRVCAIALFPQCCISRTCNGRPMVDEVLKPVRQKARSSSSSSSSSCPISPMYFLICRLHLTPTQL